MSDDNEIRHGRHCVLKMHVHLVFVAKYRRRVFDGDAISRLRTIFAKVCADFHRAAVHRTTEDTSLKLKDGYAVRAILPRPERRGLSRTGSNSCRLHFGQRAVVVWPIIRRPPLHPAHRPPSTQPPVRRERHCSAQRPRQRWPDGGTCLRRDTGPANRTD